MEYQVAILSRDVCFARMLEIECRFLQLSVLRAETLAKEDFARILLLDLDDALPMQTVPESSIIGFTTETSLPPVEEGRRCSMILHRPFSMRVLRRELMRLLRTEEGSGSPFLHSTSLPTLRWEEGTGTLSFGDASVALSPKEQKLFHCLWERHGECVSRTCLADALGASEANKTEVYVCFLRRKLRRIDANAEIFTVRGEGYRLEMN